MARLAVSAAALRRETIQRSSMVGAAGASLLAEAVGGLGGGVEPRDDPAVFDCGRGGRGAGQARGLCHLVRIHEEEAGGVPDFVSEGAGAFQIPRRSAT